MELLNPSVKASGDNSQIRFITQYNRQSSNISKILHRHWPTLRSDNIISKTIGTHPQITYSKAVSLKDKLSRNCISSENQTTKSKHTIGFYTCMSCKACKYSTNISSITVPATTRIHVIKKWYTCNTTHCVYCLTCPCDLWYIGSTIHTARKRVLEHLRAIKTNDKNYPMANHFFDKHKSNANLLKFFVVDDIPPSIRGGDRVGNLRKLESRYIIDFQTMQPTGHNKDEELHVHLQ